MISPATTAVHAQDGAPMSTRSSTCSRSRSPSPTATGALRRRPPGAARRARGRARPQRRRQDHPRAAPQRHPAARRRHRRRFRPAVVKDNPRGDPPTRRIVFQDPDDQLFMGSVRDDVAFGPRNLGVHGAELDRQVMAALGTGRDGRLRRAPPRGLSFRQRRRVAVATVLVMNRDNRARRAKLQTSTRLRNTNATTTSSPAST